VGSPGGIRDRIRFLFVVARMPPSEIRAMSSHEEIRAWCDLIVANKDDYFKHRGS
jgi:hypothetical protein